jgi:hypothetical protein
MVLISNGFLIDYSVTLKKEKWTDAKRMKLIAYLLSSTQCFTITHIALPIPTLYEKYPHLASCVDAVKTFLYGNRYLDSEEYSKRVFSPLHNQGYALYFTLLLVKLKIKHYGL